MMVPLWSPRRGHKALISALFVAVFVTFHGNTLQVHALHCKNGCGSPQDYIHFCKPVVKFRSCLAIPPLPESSGSEGSKSSPRAPREQYPWHFQDTAAKNYYYKVVNGTQLELQRQGLVDPEGHHQPPQQPIVSNTRGEKRTLGPPPSAKQMIPRSIRAVLSDKCLDKLKTFSCYRAFPACEFSSEYKLLCAQACEELREFCPKAVTRRTCSPSEFEAVEKLQSEKGSGQDGSSKHTEDDATTNLGMQDFSVKKVSETTRLIHPIAQSVNCFSLQYEGPSYSLWVIGFGINLIFSFLAALGINMQKHSMYQHQNKGKPLFRQKTWLIGMCLISAGSILDFLAFGLAPMSLLAPLAALTLVWNMILAPQFHGETLTRQNIIATSLITFGVVITVIFSSHSTPSYSLADLLTLYERPAMIYYMSVTGVFLVGLLALSSYIEKNEWLQDGLVQLLCYGGLGGTFGGQSVLFAKCTVELLKTAMLNPTVGAHAFKQWEPYLIIFAMCFSLFCQVSYLNKGLHVFNALLTVPVYQSFWIISSVLGGLVYFKEWGYMSKTEVYCFLLGLSVTISGIVYLLRARSTSKSTDQVVTKEGRSDSAYSDLGVGIDFHEDEELDEKEGDKNGAQPTKTRHRESDNATGAEFRPLRTS